MGGATDGRWGTARLLALSVLVVSLGLALLEGLSSIGWLLVDLEVFRRAQPVVEGRNLEEHYSEHDPELGWRQIPGKRLENFYGPGADVTISVDGFRGFEPVLGLAPTDRYRLICLGDSYTLGYGVGDRATYPFRLQEINPRVQTVNMGQGGYSLGQSHLWYRLVENRLPADAVVFAFITDDILRLSGVWTENGYGRPRLSLAAGKLEVSNQPVPPKIAEGQRLVGARQVTGFLIGHSALARSLASVTGLVRAAPGGEQPDLLALTWAIFAETAADCRKRGRPLFLVQFPTARDVPGTSSHNHANEIYYRTVAASVRQFADERGIPYLDLFPVFTSLPAEQVRLLYLDEAYQHFSPVGNEFVARALDAWLRQIAPGYPGPR